MLDGPSNVAGGVSGLYHGHSLAQAFPRDLNNFLSLRPGSSHKKGLVGIRIIAVQDRCNIHIHDVFYPFEYPEEWVMRGFALNEDYMLRAFLMFNEKFRVVAFNTYLEQFHDEG